MSQSFRGARRMAESAALLVDEIHESEKKRSKDYEDPEPALEMLA